MGLLDSVIQLAGSFLGGNQNQSPLLKLVVQFLSQGNARNGGLNGLVAAFQQKGLGNVVNSWVSTGPNQPIAAQQIETVLGQNTIQNFAGTLQMSPGDVSAQLSRVLPQVVDKLTPQGQIPDQTSLESALGGLLKKLG